VRVRADRATAAAIAQGTLSAQRAFMQGQLRVEGDTLTLSTTAGSLRDLDDVYADVRAGTDWSGA
jgi:putative sterol carrier protein